METPEEDRWQWCAALNSQTNLWCFSPRPRLRMVLKACMHGPGPSQLVGLSLSFTLPVPVASRRGLLSGPWTFHIFTFTPSFLGLLPPRCLHPSSGPTFPGILVVDALEPRRTVSYSAFLVSRCQRREPGMGTNYSTDTSTVRKYPDFTQKY